MILRMYYAGVGSRDTPLSVQRGMKLIALFLETEGYILRSGGADGADLAFEEGVKNPANKDIYLHKKGFNGSKSTLYNVCDAARAMARAIHPAPHKLNAGSLGLHARNCYQVLGLDLNTPANFVVCWTDGGKPVGGTRTAIMLAKKNNIPVLNLFGCTTAEECFKKFLNFYDFYN